jgi:alpha-L-rhamnosidase
MKNYYLILWLWLSLGLAPGGLLAQKVAVQVLRCEHRENPLGLDHARPRLSWQITAPGRQVRQTAYQLRAARTLSDLKAGRNLLWESGQVSSGQSVLVEYAGAPLAARQRVYWQVRVWTTAGNSAWSPPAWWEMGLLAPSDWTAQWVRAPWPEDVKQPQPAQYFRHPFNLAAEPIATARLYVTSHGLYEAFINGQRVGNDYFTPGWTSYKNRLQYQVYDVTAQLKAGPNALGATLAEGWFRGELGWENNRNYYGQQLGLLAQLEIVYASGRRQTIGSDGTWQCGQGPVRLSEIYDGEVYDARLEARLDGWATATYATTEGWQPAQATDLPKNHLVATPVPVRKILTIKPKNIFTTPQGDLVVDFGQNLTGWVRLQMQGPAGQTVRIRHAEVLDKKGNFYTANLRGAKAELNYTLRGGKVETYEPHFTFMGFRYVAVGGYPGTLTPDRIEAVALHSDMEQTGEFTCAHPLLNQLQHNIEWGQRGNFLDVPTDCPQRDERLGWTGDAQAFFSTAAFNFNVAPFFTKWLADVAADQLPNGSVPFVVPNVLGPNSTGSSGWADVATIIPWETYLAYADTRLLAAQYPSMQKWVGYMRQQAGQGYLWRTGFHFGDWLYYNNASNPSAEPGYTDREFICTAFFAYSAQLTARAAQVLGKTAEAAEYETLFQNIKTAFQKEYLTASGRLSPGSQTAYVLALMFDLLPAEQRAQAAARLATDVKKRGNHLSTGFLGTPYLAQALSENGQLTTAYDLLLQTTYPSWLYPVKMGATTIWERWDGQKTDSTFQDVGMNSFNHYAYGAIGRWMYNHLAGLDLDPAQPGYRQVRVAPRPDVRVPSARASYRSPYGLVAVEWAWANNNFSLKVTVPPNATATVRLPGAATAAVTEGGKPLANGTGLSPAQPQGPDLEIALGSGQYQFNYPLTLPQANQP